jgi:hypothetical protein
VSTNWTYNQLTMSGQKVHPDRIFYHALTAGGDLRVLADLFGPCIASAARYPCMFDWAVPPAAAS